MMKRTRKTRNRMFDDEDRIKISPAIVVEGRDDVAAVSRACDALIIPTHGYGIAAETWELISKAYKEKGIMILTDPDSAGERIRKRLTEKFPDAIQCYIDKRDSIKNDDIGVENASPEVIAEAVTKALANYERNSAAETSEFASAGDLIRLGLSGGSRSSELRDEVGRRLGIGHCNAGAMIKRLKGFGIDKDELEETVIRIKEEQNL